MDIPPPPPAVPVPQQVHHYYHPQKSGGVAALLEVLPGLFLQTFGIGHIYAGNVVNVLLCFVFIGFITWPLCWTAAMILSSLTAANACKSR